MERKEYSAGAVKVCFWFSEFRKVVTLLDEGNSMEDVKDLNQRKNIFSAPTISIPSEPVKYSARFLPV